MTVPATYTSLASRGLLDTEQRDRLTEEHLWLEGINWLEELGPAIELPHKTSMQPFAISSYGDWWCWELDRQKANSSSVILSPPDTGDCTYFAPSFEGFLFRQILEFVSNDVFCDEPDPEDVRFTLDEIKQQLEIWQSQLNEYFPEQWTAVLDELRQVPSFQTHVHSANFRYSCLLDPADEKKIEQDLLRFQKLDAKFKFNRLEVDWYGN